MNWQGICKSIFGDHIKEMLGVQCCDKHCDVGFRLNWRGILTSQTLIWYTLFFKLEKSLLIQIQAYSSSITQNKPYFTTNNKNLHAYITYWQEQTIKKSSKFKQSSNQIKERTIRLLLTDQKVAFKKSRVNERLGLKLCS